MSRYIILFFIIVIILIITISCINTRNTIEFLDSKMTLNTIQSNTTYYNSMTSLDWMARHVNNINEYYDMMRKSVVNFTENEKSILTDAINRANNKIDKISLHWFNGKLANKLKWKIGLVEGRLYEYGLPHTINDTIILNRNDISTKYDSYHLINTLIHEKVHIYQKAYPMQVKQYLDINNYKEVRKRTKMDNIRANPDIDDMVYSKDGTIYATQYNESPLSIIDVTNHDQTYEHPFERMAIEIAKL